MSTRDDSSSPSKRTRTVNLYPTAPPLPLGDLDADIHGSHVRPILSTPTSSFPPTSAPQTPAMPPSSSSSSPLFQAPTSAPPQFEHEYLQIKRLSPSARLPTRGSAFAAGYDLYASQDTVIPRRGMGLVSTGVAIAVPAGTYGRVAPRSGLAVKHSITTGAGVVDYDYRGEVKVVLFNLSEQADFEVRVGDRVAQLVLERIVTPEVVEVEELVGTERGAGGFGSTGGFGAVGQRGSQRLVVVGNGGVKRKEVDDGEMDTGA